MPKSVRTARPVVAQQDVRRFHVAVLDTCGVRGAQRLQYLAADPRRLHRCQRARFQPFVERDAGTSSMTIQGCGSSSMI